tara:strand:+ start:149 stop:565 length:417 start_codon:yes stop_codon:yes gene_type:complete
MLDIRHINYFIISIISSGLTYKYFNHISEKQIINLKEEIIKLSEKNKNLREELNLTGDLHKIVERLDDCLTILMKNIMELDVNTLDEDLTSEIKNICKRIIAYIPEKEKINPEYEKSKEVFNLVSYDTLVNELSKIST